MNAAVEVKMVVMTPQELEALVERTVRRFEKGPAPKAYTIPAAAKLLGVGPASLRRRIKAKLVAVLPDLGPVRISAKEVERLLGERR